MATKTQQDLDRELATLSASLMNSTQSRKRACGQATTGEPAASTCPSHIVAGIFKKFQARYGHKQTAAILGIERLAVAEWGEILAGLNLDQIAAGLANWNSDWPPSAHEFRKACIGAGRNEYGLDYVPEYYRPENAITDRSRLLSSGDRDAQRETARGHLAELRARLNGKQNHEPDKMPKV